MTESQYIDISVDGLKLKRKAKFSVCFDGEPAVSCISAMHVSKLLESRGHEGISQCDVYNWCNPSRGHKRLENRIPQGVSIVKLSSRHRDTLEPVRDEVVTSP